MYLKLKRILFNTSTILIYVDPPDEERRGQMERGEIPFMQYNMANLHRLREMIVNAYFEDFLDDEDFLMLYDINHTSNPDFQYLNDGYKFNLDNFNDDECNSYFR